ncbi:MAG: hypothetical protein ACRDYX_22150 [Egibacteraceae bacterium]
MGTERPEQTATVSSGVSTEPPAEPRILLVDLGNVKNLTLGSAGNQTKDKKYFFT